MDLLFQDFHASSYGILHGVRVRYHRVRMGPSGDFTGALNTLRGAREIHADFMGWTRSSCVIL